MDSITITADGNLLTAEEIAYFQNEGWSSEKIGLLQEWKDLGYELAEAAKAGLCRLWIDDDGLPCFEELKRL